MIPFGEVRPVYCQITLASGDSTSYLCHVCLVPLVVFELHLEPLGRHFAKWGEATVPIAGANNWVPVSFFARGVSTATQVSRATSTGTLHFSGNIVQERLVPWTTSMGIAHTRLEIHGDFGSPQHIHGVFLSLWKLCPGRLRSPTMNPRGFQFPATHPRDYYFVVELLSAKRNCCGNSAGS